MAKLVKVNGRTFVQPNWQDKETDIFTTYNDDKRERKDTNKLKLATMYLFGN